MKLLPLELSGAYIIELEPFPDDRGFFARSFCGTEFRELGLETHIKQSNISQNASRGTLRGMHFQVPPYEETKLVRCTSGSIYDVVIDVRPDSQTYGRHEAVLLSAKNHKQLYIPKGFAHGFQTLEDNTEVFYEMFDDFVPGSASGYLWNDPAFAISWPLPVSIMSDKDIRYPIFRK